MRVRSEVSIWSLLYLLYLAHQQHVATGQSTRILDWAGIIDMVDILELIVTVVMLITASRNSNLEV